MVIEVVRQLVLKVVQAARVSQPASVVSRMNVGEVVEGGGDGDVALDVEPPQTRNKL